MPGSGAPACTLIALALVINPGAAAAATAPVTIDLWLGARAGLEDSGVFQLVKDTAGALLAKGGIALEWRACGSDEPCPGHRRFGVPVHVLPRWKSTDREMCGEVVRDAQSGAPIVLVYFDCLAEMTNSMRSGTVGRSHPSLATLKTGHVAGLTIVHELGHALGLSHGPQGVMKARWSIADLIALRQSRLVFSTAEIDQMRAVAEALVPVEDPTR